MTQLMFKPFKCPLAVWHLEYIIHICINLSRELTICIGILYSVQRSCRNSAMNVNISELGNMVTWQHYNLVMNVKWAWSGDGGPGWGIWFVSTTASMIKIWITKNGVRNQFCFSADGLLSSMMVVNTYSLSRSRSCIALLDGRCR